MYDKSNFGRGEDGMKSMKQRKNKNYQKNDKKTQPQTLDVMVMGPFSQKTIKTKITKDITKLKQRSRSRSQTKRLNKKKRFYKEERINISKTRSLLKNNYQKKQVISYLLQLTIKEDGKKQAALKELMFKYDLYLKLEKVFKLENEGKSEEQKKQSKEKREEFYEKCKKDFEFERKETGKRGSIAQILESDLKDHGYQLRLVNEDYEHQHLPVKNLHKQNFDKLFTQGSKIHFNRNINRNLIIRDHYQKSKLTYKIESENWQRSQQKQSFISLTGVRLILFQIVTFLSCFFGPATAWLMFCVFNSRGKYQTTLRFKADMRKKRYRIKGFLAALFVFLYACGLWLIGYGPQILNYFLLKIMKTNQLTGPLTAAMPDVPLQVYTRSIIMVVYVAIYPQIKIIQSFIEQCVLSDGNWRLERAKNELKFADWNFHLTFIENPKVALDDHDQKEESKEGGAKENEKNVLYEIQTQQTKVNAESNEESLDEVNFEVDPDQEKIQIPAHDLLPCFKKTGGTYAWKYYIWGFSIAVTVINITFYSLGNLTSRPSQWKYFPDPKAKFDTLRNPNATSPKYQLTGLGNSMFSFVVMIVGYGFECSLIIEFYFLLFDAIGIHWMCRNYLYGLLNLQNYDCTEDQLKQFNSMIISKKSEQSYKDREYSMSSDEDEDEGPEEVKCQQVDSGNTSYFSDSDSSIEKKIKREMKKLEVEPNFKCNFSLCGKQLIGEEDKNLKGEEHHEEIYELTSPIDMANLTNITNIMYMRKLVFQLYKLPAELGQGIILVYFILFLIAQIIIFASMYQPTSSMALFYGLYYPDQLYWFGIIVTWLYFLPVAIVFMVIFWFETQINQYFVLQQLLWHKLSDTFQRINFLRDDYFIPIEYPEPKEIEDGQREEYTDLQIYQSHVNAKMAGDKNKTQYKFQTAKNVLVTYKTGHKNHKKHKKPEEESLANNASGTKNANECRDVYKVSFALESDNNFITYLVKRIAENMKKDDDIALQEYIPQYSQAFDIASVDIQTDKKLNQFMILGLVPTNWQLLSSTLTGLVYFFYKVISAKAKKTTYTKTSQTSQSNQSNKTSQNNQTSQNKKSN